MKKLLLFILLFSAYVCGAQNYQCLQAGVKHYFTSGQEYLRGIRIDSVRTYGDTTIYYPFQTPRGSYSMFGAEDTLDATGGSWLGKKVLQLSDGTFIFDDEWSDSVIIKTQANFGDNWIFYRDTSSLYYLASVVSVDTMTVLGVLDTVKTIQVNAYVGVAMITTDPVNGFQIMLSKNHGFVQVFDLYTFPYHLPNGAYHQGLDYYLDQSITQPPYPMVLNSSFVYGMITSGNSVYTLSSFVSPSFAQLYQWNAGDVYEYANCFSYNNYLSCSCDPVSEFDMDTVKAIDYLPDTVEYHYSGWKASFSGYYPSTTTGVIIADSTRLIGTTIMPEEYGISALYYYLENDYSYCIRGSFYGVVYTNELNGAVYIPPFEVGARVFAYKEPLGILYSFGCSADIQYNVVSQQLLYYNRGGGDYCGTMPIIPVSVPMVGLINSITTFPNPATTTLNIQSTNLPITDISITNLLGQVVSSKRYNGGGLQVDVDVSRLAGGVYFVKVNGSAVRKFVKE